jgi:PAS domain S-box-containing protein
MKPNSEHGGLPPPRQPAGDPGPCSGPPEPGLPADAGVYSALLDSEARYRTLAEHLPWVLIRFDREHRVLYLNPAAEQVTGTSADRAVGRTYREIGLPAALCDVWEPAIDRVFASGLEQDLEFMIEPERGGRTFYLKLAPEYNADGSTRRVLGIGTDITARKRAEAQVLRQSAVLEGIARILESVLSADCEEALGKACLRVAEEVTVSQFGFLSELNEEGRLAVVAMTVPGWKESPLARQAGGGSLTMAVRGIYGKVIIGARAFFTNDPANHQDRIGLPEGHPPLRSFLGVPLVRDGRVIGVLAVGNRDGGYSDEELGAVEALAPTMVEAFARKRAEQALRNSEKRWRTLAEDLAQADARLRDQQEWLRSANDRLVAADRRKDEFLSTLSHELRTPLNAIVGWSQMLQRGMLDDDGQQKAIEVIARNALLQARIIDDVLDVSRIITGKVTLDSHEVAIGPVILQAAESIRPALEAKSIRLVMEVEPGLVVRGDAGRLQQVFWNLLSNAVKFTPDGGCVTVTMVRDDRLLRVCVRDTGIGIAPSILPHIFERFTQADASSSRTHGGLGLGLAIVRHLVELHGGSVTAESDGITAGTTLTVRLPVQGSAQAGPSAVAASQPACEPPIAAPDGGLRNIRVLAVDDEPDARALVQAVLEQDGAVVTLAESASEALARLAGGSFDVLIADIGMPAEDGYWLLRRVRERSAIPAIALTAYGRETDRAMAAAAGFAEHLTKPVLPQRLLAAVRAVAAGLRR